MKKKKQKNIVFEVNTRAYNVQEKFFYFACLFADDDDGYDNKRRKKTFF